MKTLLAAVALCAPILLASVTAASAGDVTVNVHGLQAKHGTVYVVLDDQDHFLKPGAAIKTMLADPPAGDHSFVLKDVPPGDYAVVVLHDENDNRQMDYDSSGRPTEGWALTRFAADQMRFPTFDDAKVTVAAGGGSFDVTMNYPGQ
ncbi:MAG TPA: DUF2141 domain-containing protein [Caulobacteraceae bacterium]|jgi:uncharacterized protein (DUF2141 family)